MGLYHSGETNIKQHHHGLRCTGLSDNGIEWMSGYCSEQLEHCQLAPDDITSLQESESGVPTPFARWMSRREER